LHAGKQNGFDAGASLIFVSGTKSGNYHDLMNGENFEHWMLTQLLPNLEELSVIIMNNAPYHSILLETPPTQLEKGRDKCLAATEGNSLCRGILQS
jgi:hypothetical protein